MYREYLPPDQLKDWVVCYWTSSLTASGNFRRIFPDGCADIIFNFGGPTLNLGAGGQFENYHTAFVVGTMTCPMLSRPLAEVDLMGIRFQPGTLHFLSGLSQSEFRNASVGLQDLNNHCFGHLREALEEKTVFQRIAFLNHWVLQRLSKYSPDSRKMKVFRSVLSDQQAGKVVELARDSGYSIRQLERMFQEYVGVSPKEYLLISKFIAVKNELEKERNESLLELAVNYGFHDHAHLTHVFKRFAGLTPSDFLSLH